MINSDAATTEGQAPRRIPRATYRLQFNKGFTFKQAQEIVPYLEALGISHIYASPYFKAGPDSMHGYDICDHNELNPVIGTREEFDQLVETLHAHDMGQIVDFVPNHMGVATELNIWWMDVLENGRCSQYAPYFDIDWHPIKEELEGKVLLPILGDQYGRVLERGELKLDFMQGGFYLRYFSHLLPLALRSYRFIIEPALQVFRAKVEDEAFVAEVQSILTAIHHLPDEANLPQELIAERSREREIIKKRIVRRCDEQPAFADALQQAMRELEGTPGEPRSFDPLDEVLEAQNYRLSFWRVAGEQINYRRFFDINDLAAIRVELPAVFESTHRLVFQLIESGAIDGLRIDHVDGLLNPGEYLAQLRAGCVRPIYLVIEKILLGDEMLRLDWPVDGTTGYDFANEAIRLLIDPSSEGALTECYYRSTGETARSGEIVIHSKQLAMDLALASEVHVLSRMLDRLSEKNRWYRDFTLNTLTAAVREVISCFSIYRTYHRPGEEPSLSDREAILRAVSLAKRRNPAMERSVFNFLGEILLGKFPENIDAETREAHIRFVLKFQQCTGPIMAKGVEDTAFYVQNRFLALNEVGGRLDQFACSVEEFHERIARRAVHWPHAMLATSTHDTKVSEDVRARIAAISEIPDTWRKGVDQWDRLTVGFCRYIEGDRVPSANEVYRIYQILAGTWPDDENRDAVWPEYVRRIQDYMLKATREAKVNSSWVQPNEDWEQGISRFIEGILGPEGSRFQTAFAEVAGTLRQLGAVNSLAQTVLKLTCPGVPDIYQGSELWDFSLVDPDNRRPVDYDVRRRRLAEVGEATPADLMRDWPSGGIKLRIVKDLLQVRREHSGAFEHGRYEPVRVRGEFAEHCVAFVRAWEEMKFLVVVPRLSRTAGFPPIGNRWADTEVLLETRGELRNCFTGATVTAAPVGVRVAELLAELPLGVFEVL